MSITDLCLHELFEKRVDERPDHQALLWQRRSLSYAEVDEQANRLAHLLRQRGLSRGMFAGLLLERSEVPIIAMLAVMKTGAAYVPLEPIYPNERMSQIIEDTSLQFLISEVSLAERVQSFFAGTAVFIDSPDLQFPEDGKNRLAREETGVIPEDLCYAMFTSGTTGRPKGILTEHQNVTHFLEAFDEVCQLESKDRVFQGFSHCFDGSVEEIWMAFLAGATIVVGPPAAERLEDRTTALLKEQEVTVFSTVPTFLRGLQKDVPSLSLLIVSGEPCPPELVKQWVKPGRRMLNVYGPTETTVNATAWDCKPEESVSIGRPLRGYEFHLLDENCKPTPPGEVGELYISSPGVARGYLNRETETAYHFVTAPPDLKTTYPRLYRTGDLVRKKPSGDYDFLGRADGQVKIRGFRVETEEIAALLRGWPAIKDAVVHVHKRDDLQELAAFVVLKEDALLERRRLVEHLRAKLPFYMVPRFLEVLPALPLLPSGKVNKRELPTPRELIVQSSKDGAKPQTPEEQIVGEIWSDLFDNENITINDDFFHDLGGYSLLAARTVNRLRDEGFDCSLRQVYEAPTIKELGPMLVPCAQKTARPRAREVIESVPLYERCLVHLGQFLFALLFYTLVWTVVAIFIFTVYFVIVGSWPWTTGLYIILALSFGTYPLLLISSIVLKWIIIGRYKPGSHSLYSFTYFRHWLAMRIQAISGVSLLAGTPVMGLYYWLMGAKIGNRVIIDTPHCAVYDLISIGDDSSIGAHSQILGYSISDGMLHLGSISIGSRCFVGIHSTLGLNTSMADGARLGSMSALLDNEEIGLDESYLGSPAKPGEVPAPEPRPASTKRHPFLYGLLHFLSLELLGFWLFVASLPLLAVAIYILIFYGTTAGIASVYLLIPVSIVTFCCTIAATKAIILRRIKPGVYPLESLLFLRKWLVDTLVATSGSFLHSLYTTIYLPPWLRMLGADIGSRAEISTVTMVTPDLIKIDDESFFADGSMVGGRHIFGGSFQIDRNEVGRRSFVGNNALLPLGHDLGQNSLLGVLSLSPTEERCPPDKTEWLGSPAFRLPYRQKVEGFTDEVLYKPTLSLYAQRLVIDAIRILIPNLIVATDLVLFIAFIIWGYHHLHWSSIVLLTPIVGLLLALGAALAVALLKWVIMGRFEPVIKPLWSRYVWWNEVINGAYETIAAPVLSPFIGTPIFNAYLRLLGCKVGRLAYVETTLFSEFDLVSIGDYAALNVGVVVQNHLFEDRIMKSSHVDIKEGCTLGNMAIILYDTQMGEGSSLAPMSLLMKGETVPPDSHWAGIPTRRL